MNTRFVFSALAATALFGAAQLHAEGTTTTTTTTTTATTTTPAEACRKLVDAAKADDFKTFEAFTMSGHPMMKSKEQKFEKMGKNYMDKIKAITCGTEHMAGDHAFVESESGTTKRFIPFVNTNGQWKFDMKTYMSFYQMKRGMMKTEKSM